MGGAQLPDRYAGRTRIFQARRHLALCASEPGGGLDAAGSPRIEWRVIARLLMTRRRRGQTEPRLARRVRIAMGRCFLAYAAIVICSSVPPNSAAHAQSRAVLELFTSQRRSSCPPADPLLGELAAAPSLLPVSVPLHYLAYLGW